MSAPRTLPTEPRTVAIADLMEYLPDLGHAGEVLLREAERMDRRLEPGSAEQLRTTADRLADLGQILVAALDEGRT